MVDVRIPNKRDNAISLLIDHLSLGLGCAFVKGVNNKYHW
jgi:hypothetical protein